MMTATDSGNASPFSDEELGSVTLANAMSELISQTDMTVMTNKSWNGDIDMKGK